MHRYSLPDHFQAMDQQISLRHAPSQVLPSHLSDLIFYVHLSLLTDFAPAIQVSLPFFNFPGKLLPQDLSGCGSLCSSAIHSRGDLPLPLWRLGSQALIIFLKAITCPFLPGNLTSCYPGWFFSVCPIKCKAPNILCNLLIFMSVA